MRKLSILLALFAGTMLPLTAVAQDSSKTSSSKKGKSSKKSKSSSKKKKAKKEVDGQSFSSEQILLNNQAYEASSKGEYKKAEQIYNAMLQIGEFNIIWLNLAKTYLVQDKCMEAADALKRVYSAPHISDIPSEDIEKKALDYTAQMNEKCSSTVIIKCNPTDMKITIDGGQEMACTETPMALVPGRHVVYGQTSFGFNTVAAECVAYETTEIAIDVIDYETVAKDAGVTPDELRKKSTLFKALGYSFLGVGTAMLGAGLGLSIYYYYDYTDKHQASLNGGDGAMPTEELRDYRKKTEKLINTGYGLSAVGGAMLATGIVLVVIDAVKIKPQIDILESKSRSFRFAPVLSPEFSGAVFTTTF